MILRATGRRLRSVGVAAKLRYQGLDRGYEACRDSAIVLRQATWDGASKLARQPDAGTAVGNSLRWDIPREIALATGAGTGRVIISHESI